MAEARIELRDEFMRHELSKAVRRGLERRQLFKDFSNAHELSFLGAGV